MRIDRRVRALAFCVLLTASQGAHAGKETSLKQVQAAVGKLDALAEDVLRRTGSPGLAIAVVYDDQTVYLKGFGVCEAGAKQAVDPDTVFQLASVSKPITTTVLATLAGEGRISWDDRVVELWPSFRLYEDWPTQAATLRDFLCHRSGLPDHAGDHLEDLDYDRSQILHRLRRLKPASSFRSKYAYTNFGFTAAAEAVALKVGAAWEDLTAQRLFRPAGMHSTSSRFADFAKSPKHAKIHVREGGRWVPKYVRNPDAQSPAGGVSSTARDMTAFLRLHLADGTLDGRRIVPAEPLAETHRGQIITSTSPLTRKPSLYGLGWGIIEDDKGRVYWKHSGAFFIGERTEIALLPAENLGIVVLSNSGPNGIPEGISMSFFDEVLLGKPSRDWLEFANRMFEQEVRAEQGDPFDFARPPKQPTPPMDLNAYVGVYENDYFGPIDVAVVDDSLVFRIGPRKRAFPVRHWDRDLFVFTPTGESSSGPSSAAFLIGTDRRAKQLVIDCYNEQGQGTFVRVGR